MVCLPGRVLLYDVNSQRAEEKRNEILYIITGVLAALFLAVAAVTTSELIRFFLIFGGTLMALSTIREMIKALA